MKKSSLGRRSSVTAPRKTADFQEKKTTHIPMLSRSKSSTSFDVRGPPNVMARKRDLSNDRISMNRPRDPSTDRISQYSGLNTPCTGNERTPRTLSSGRPSSMGGRKGDDRPLNDKEWQSLASALICEVLNSDMTGSALIGNSSIIKQSSMTLALFVDICNCFLKRLEPSIDINRTNYITELPYRLKQINYRGKVDKSLLTTVNTMHAWPNVLGILHYLAELVQFENSFVDRGWDPMYPKNQLDGEETDELDFRYVVPLLHDLWSKKNLFDDIDHLLEVNKDKLQLVIHQSGFTDDIERQECDLEQEVNMYQQQYDEAEIELNALNSEYNAANERLEEIKNKESDRKEEVNALKAKLLQEMKIVEDLENENIHLEEEIKQMDVVYNLYEKNDHMSPNDYEAYRKKKKELLESIEFEKLTFNEITDQIFDLELDINVAKKEIDKEFRNYISVISKVLEDEPSVKTALSYARPKYGATPYNESTCIILDRTLEKYTNKVKELEVKFTESQEDSMFQFNKNEELKDKKAKLEDLKNKYGFILKSFEKEEAELQKQLENIAEKNSEIEREIVATENALKSNKEQFENLEKECELRENRVIKFKEVCQKKLDLEFKYLKLLNEKLNALEDKESRACKQVNANIRKLITNLTVPPQIIASLKENLARAELQLKNFTEKENQPST